MLCQSVAAVSVKKVRRVEPSHLQRSSDHVTQNMFYNGWKSDHFVTWGASRHEVQKRCRVVLQTETTQDHLSASHADRVGPVAGACPARSPAIRVPPKFKPKTMKLIFLASALASRPPDLARPLAIDRCLPFLQAPRPNRHHELPRRRERRRWLCRYAGGELVGHATHDMLKIGWMNLDGVKKFALARAWAKRIWMEPTW